MHRPAPLVSTVVLVDTEHKLMAAASSSAMARTVPVTTSVTHATASVSTKPESSIDRRSSGVPELALSWDSCRVVGLFCTAHSVPVVGHHVTPERS